MAECNSAVLGVLFIDISSRLKKNNKKFIVCTILVFFITKSLLGKENVSTFVGTLQHKRIFI